MSRRKKIVKNGEKGYYPNTIFDGNKILINSPKEREIEEVTTKHFEILMPISQYSWESYHSSINQAGGQNVVSKELSFHMNLINAPQTFNLYERNRYLNYNVLALCNFALGKKHPAFYDLLKSFSAEPSF